MEDNSDLFEKISLKCWGLIFSKLISVSVSLRLVRMAPFNKLAINLANSGSVEEFRAFSKAVENTESCANKLAS